MVRFAVRLLVFASFFFIYDKVFIIVAHRSAEAEVDKRLEYVVKGEMSKDIIIAGSSTGSRDIIAGKIAQETGLSAYNLCYPGSDVEFHEFVIKTLVQFNKPPRMILFVVDDNTEFLDSESIIYRKDRLYPLIKYPHIRKELESRQGDNSFFSSLLILDRLNKYNLDLRRKRFTVLDTIIACGSMPISWKPENIRFSYDSQERNYPLDNENPEKIVAFREIIKTCNSNNIKLVFVFPPIYKAHSKSFESRIRELGGNDAFYYVYNSENPVYKDEDYYYDEIHLLRKGAEVFTQELVSYIHHLIERDT